MTNDLLSDEFVFFRDTNNPLYYKKMMFQDLGHVGLLEIKTM